MWSRPFGRLCTSAFRVSNSWTRLGQIKKPIMTSITPKENTMKDGLYCISDIHAEFYRDDPENLIEVLKNYSPPGVKYCVLAGDIGSVADIKSYRKVLEYYANLYTYVILVAGNHEFYGSYYNFHQVIRTLEKECEALGIHFLHRKTVVLDGVRFIGATLWTIIDEKGVKSISDFQHVFRHQVDYVGAFVDDYRFIKGELEKQAESKQPTVVVTHHLPTSKLVHPRFHFSPANAAFHTNILDTITLYNVQYFICGHSHETQITSYGNTKLILNPLGYRSEKRETVASKKVYQITKSANNEQTNTKEVESDHSS